MYFIKLSTLSPPNSRFLGPRKWLQIWNSRIWRPFYIVKVIFGTILFPKVPFSRFLKNHCNFLSQPNMVQFLKFQSLWKAIEILYLSILCTHTCTSCNPFTPKICTSFLRLYKLIVCLFSFTSLCFQKVLRRFSERQ